VHERVPVPLVIHGGTGFPADAVEPAIAAGVAKFNVGTVLRRAFLDGLASAVTALPAGPDVHTVIGSHGPADVLRAGQAPMVEAVRGLIRQYGGRGRAA
jgi:fructose/tagatose bisphosphate aldolase